MGLQEVDAHPSPEALRAFSRELRAELRILERLIDEGRVESGVRRIGAEQEMFLVDDRGLPSPTALSVLEAVGGGAVHDRAGPVQPRGEPRPACCRAWMLRPARSRTGGATRRSAGSCHLGGKSDRPLGDSAHLGQVRYEPCQHHTPPPVPCAERRAESDAWEGLSASNRGCRRAVHRT